MVPGPWNRTGRPRDSRSHCVAVVCRKAAFFSSCSSDRSCPFSMTWTVLGRRRVETHILRVCVLPHCGVLVCRQSRAASRTHGSSRVTRESGHRSHAARSSDACRLCSRSSWSPSSGGLPCPTRSRERRFDTTAPPCIAAGPRDRWFFVDGWSSLVVEGNVTIAVCRAAWRESQNPAARSPLLRTHAALGSSRPFSARHGTSCMCH